jgi:hypothetical protein
MARTADPTASDTSPALPDTLTHYYRREPFRSLSELSDNEVADVLAQLEGYGPLEYRLTRSEYLPKRRAIESQMRAAFIAKGGRPVRADPHYFILGTFSLYEDDADMQSVAVSLADVSPDVLSFTYTDSFFSYSDHNLRGVAIPPRPYHEQVFTLTELPALVTEHGLPGERWRTDPDHRFDVYIEAQLWDDGPVAHLLRRNE